MELVQLHEIGRIPYRKAWELQHQLFDEVVADKLGRREIGQEKDGGLHHLILCEHPPVFTLGRSGSDSNLLVAEDWLAKQGIEFVRINRGGDVTFHGPGQLVGYPILDLDCFFTDIGKYLRFLEEAVIKVLAHYGLQGHRLPGATGVWLDPENPFKARKICAMGIRASRWVTMHGYALNVNTDLDHFNHIIPCGIDDKQVTSMAKELGRSLAMEEVKELWKRAFSELFDLELVKSEKVLVTVAGKNSGPKPKKK